MVVFPNKVIINNWKYDHTTLHSKSSMGNIKTDWKLWIHLIVLINKVPTNNWKYDHSTLHSRSSMGNIKTDWKLWIHLIVLINKVPTNNWKCDYSSPHSWFTLRYVLTIVMRNGKKLNQNINSKQPVQSDAVWKLYFTLQINEKRI